MREFVKVWAEVDHLNGGWAIMVSSAPNGGDPVERCVTSCIKSKKSALQTVRAIESAATLMGAAVIA